MAVNRKDELMGEVREALRTMLSAADAHDEVVARRLGINRTDHQCMDILDQNGGLLTAGDLARASGLTPKAGSGRPTESSTCTRSTSLRPRLRMPTSRRGSRSP